VEKVRGVGGVFQKVRDPERLAERYRAHLGVPVGPGQSHGVLASAGAGEMKVWSAFPIDTA
jgi:hypothetical protein